jgi:vacuolar-type H+-ATPase subunit H
MFGFGMSGLMLTTQCFPTTIQFLLVSGSRHPPLSLRKAKGIMSENIVHQVRSIENAADEIIEKAREEARKIESSTEETIEELKRLNKEELEKEVEEYRKKTEEETKAKLQELDDRAKELHQKLDSLGQEKFNKAVASVVDHLR